MLLCMGKAYFRRERGQNQIRKHFTLEGGVLLVFSRHSLNRK
jgi:hypothetical protein